MDVEGVGQSESGIVVVDGVGQREGNIGVDVVGMGTSTLVT